MHETPAICGRSLTSMRDGIVSSQRPQIACRSVLPHCRPHLSRGGCKDDEVFRDRGCAGVRNRIQRPSDDFIVIVDRVRSALIPSEGREFCDAPTVAPNDGHDTRKCGQADQLRRSCDAPAVQPAIA